MKLLQLKGSIEFAMPPMTYVGVEFSIKDIEGLTREKGLVTPDYVHPDTDKEGATVVEEIEDRQGYPSTNVFGVNEVC
jgi:hypothetical protein